MEKDRVSVGAGVTALLLLGAFARGIFAAATVPDLCPPPFAGSLHPWVSTAVLAGLLIGAVFFPERWQRASAWACALTFAMFEFAFALPVSLMRTSIPDRLETALLLAGGLGLFFLLLAPALWLDGRRPPGEGR